MTRVFVVLSAYYKHGEAETDFFTHVGELKDFLLEQVQRYDKKFTLDDLEDDEYDVEDEEEMIYALIKTAIRLGKEELREQAGWGILKISEIKFGKDIGIYSFE